MHMQCVRVAIGVQGATTGAIVVVGGIPVTGPRVCATVIHVTEEGCVKPT